jgi:hypothetical protein
MPLVPQVRKLPSNDFITIYIWIMRTEHWLLVNIQHIANKDYINKLLGSSQHSTRNVNLLITPTLGSVMS